MFYWHWHLLNIQTSQSFRNNPKDLYVYRSKKPFKTRLPLETPSVLEHSKFIN